LAQEFHPPPSRSTSRFSTCCLETQAMPTDLLAKWEDQNSSSRPSQSSDGHADIWIESEGNGVVFIVWLLNPCFNSIKNATRNAFNGHSPQRTKAHIIVAGRRENEEKSDCNDGKSLFLERLSKNLYCYRGRHFALLSYERG
jgi:hypothetical protein